MTNSNINMVDLAHSLATGGKPRDITAERITIVLAAIENARARMQQMSDAGHFSHEQHEEAHVELFKILRAKDAHDRAVKSQ